jgi:hypothetical protein
MWGGFAIFWVVGASSGDPHWFGLFGLPFVAVGLYAIFGRFIYKANRKRRTTSAVTNRRVLEIVRGLRGGDSVNATYLGSIPSISTSTTSGGYRAVEVFGARQASEVCFYDIPDPRRVADLVERLRAAKDEGD